MRKIVCFALAAAAAGVTAPANATLVVYAPGGVTEAVYDTASNLTWYALASGGYFNYPDAWTQATQLVVDGVSGWRLPHAAGSSDQPVQGVGYVTTVTGFTTAGEVGGLYTAVKDQYGSIGASPLSSYDSSALWTDGVDANYYPSVAVYVFSNGEQGFSWNYGSNHFTAVQDGNPFDLTAGVPEISTWVMMLSGGVALGAAGLAKRRRKPSIGLVE